MIRPVPINFIQLFLQKSEPKLGFKSTILLLQEKQKRVREEKPPNHRPRGQPRLKAKLRPPPPLPRSAQRLRQKKDQVNILIFWFFLQWDD
jgi:hypothetical protein